MRHRVEPRPLLHRVLPVRRRLPQRGAECAVKATTLIAIIAAGFAVSLTGSAATSAETAGARAAVAGTSASTVMQASALPRGGTARGPSLSSVAAARLAAERRAQALTGATHQGDVRRAIRAQADGLRRAQAAGLRRAQAAGLRRAQAARVSRARERARLMADPQEAAQLLAAQRGWGEEQFACLDSLWTKESGWQHTADNPTSSAFGIPQALPGSKMASAGSDWRTNPVTQVRWGLGYIAARYDTPCRAWRHSQSNDWY